MRPPCPVRSRRGWTICHKTRPILISLCLKVSRPDAQDLKNVKRVGRFLVGRPWVGCLFEWQAHPSALHTLADADWAGVRQSRKSVSGGMILHEKHQIKAWMKQLNIVATSTAEVVLYAGNRAATESMAVQAFAKDLGKVVPIRLHIDSSAALSIISRTGLGKAEHIEIQYCGSWHRFDELCGYPIIHNSLFSLCLFFLVVAVHAQFTHVWFTAAFRLFIPRLSGKR